MKLSCALLARASVFVALGSGVASGSPGLADPISIETAAKLFGSRESHWGPELSPSGKMMLFLSSGNGARTDVNLEDLSSGDVSVLSYSTGTPEQIQWCNFATEVSVICEFSGNRADGHRILSFSRLVSVDTATKVIKPLGTKSTIYDSYIHQFDGVIVDWNRGQPGSVFIARNYVPQEYLGEVGIADQREGLGVDRVDLASLKASAVEPADAHASEYLSDGQGNVRVAGFDQIPVGGTLNGVTEFRYRPSGTRQWATLGTYDQRTSVGIQPLAVDAASNSVFALEGVDGRDALFSIKLDGSGTRTLIAKNDKVDIDEVVRLDRGMPVIGYSYTDERKHIVYFDPVYRSLAAALSAALPESPLIDFQSASSDGKRLLIHASSDTDPGAYYLLDRASRQMRPVLLAREPIEDHPLATVRAISFKAADGTMIPAYLTGAMDGAAPRGAVVLPHGGPSARDDWGFDWLAQFLAARGYVVIQPNFRGSSGYGAEFEGKNAFRDWRSAMSDIDDAAAYLVKQGIADPNRIAILGWSYGGYAALESAVLHPTRYKAVVAIAPVTDINALRREYEGFTNAKLVKAFVGPAASAQEGSPLEGASHITAPVLLVHGNLDANVSFEESLHMADSLQKYHVPVELLRFPKLDHQLDDSDARITMLTKIGELLDRTIH